MKRLLARACRSTLLLAAACLGCGGPAATPPPSPPRAASPLAAPVDDARLAEADFRLLFIGNSHTGLHDLPRLVARMIEAQHPGKKAATRYIATAFLEDAARNLDCLEQIKTRPWGHVILQAQKISMSGRVEYSRKEGIELARLAQQQGAAPIYFAEWGLKDKPGDGVRQTKVYQEMADECGARVAPIARAWDLALEADPSLSLHSADGNHQSPFGAFLTACVLYGAITGESPATLADFPYEPADAPTRKRLAEAAEKALQEQPPPTAP